MQRTDLLEKYAKIQWDMARLEEEKDIIKDLILEELEINKLDKVQSEFGSFTRATRTTYTYTDKVKGMEENVKIAKAKEQEKGIAKAKETRYLVYSVKKE